jgi:hypothetical protein
MPGDIAYMGGTNERRDVTLSGSSASVAAVYGAGRLIVDGVTLTVTGSLTDPTSFEGAEVLNGGAIALTGAGRVQGGVLKGKGTVAGLVNNGGTVEPGAFPGTLSVAGAYSQGHGGTLRMEMEGDTSGTFDVLSVAGAAALGGTFELAGSCVPAASDTLRIVTGTLGGQWGVRGRRRGAVLRRLRGRRDHAVRGGRGGLQGTGAHADAVSHAHFNA